MTSWLRKAVGCGLWAARRIPPSRRGNAPTAPQDEPGQLDERRRAPGALDGRRSLPPVSPPGGRPSARGPALPCLPKIPEPPANTAFRKGGRRAGRGAWQVVLFAGLAIAVVCLAVVAFERWFSPSNEGPVPLGVDEGDEEIVWLYPATQATAWQLFVTGMHDLADQRSDITLEDQAFPRETTAVPQVTLTVNSGRQRRLVFRWYKLTSKWTTQAWVRALLRDGRPQPYAIIGGSNSNRARELARALREIVGPEQLAKGKGPLLLLTRATADCVSLPPSALHSRDAGSQLGGGGDDYSEEPDEDLWSPARKKNGCTALQQEGRGLKFEAPESDLENPIGTAGFGPPRVPLNAIYPGRTFRFCFTNKQMADAVIDFIWSQKTLRPDQKLVYTVQWDDDSYSYDLIDGFTSAVHREVGRQQLRSSAHLASELLGTPPTSLLGVLPPLYRSKPFLDQPYTPTFFPLRIASSVGSFALPNQFEQSVVQSLLEQTPESNLGGAGGGSPFSKGERADRPSERHSLRSQQAWQPGRAPGALDGRRSLPPASPPVQFSSKNTSTPEAAQGKRRDRHSTDVPDRPLMLLAGGTRPSRRFLRTLASSAPSLARRFVVATGDSISFNTIYRDQQVSWPISDLPFVLVLFCHFDPVDRAAGFQPLGSAGTARGKPQEGRKGSPRERIEGQGADFESEQPYRSSANITTGTESILLYRQIILALVNNELPWRTSPSITACPGDDDEARNERVVVQEDRKVRAKQNADLGGAGEVRNPKSETRNGGGLFAKDGTRRVGVHERVVCLRPHFHPNNPTWVLPEATIEVWKRKREKPGKRYTWVRSTKLIVRYGP